MDNMRPPSPRLSLATLFETRVDDAPGALAVVSGEDRYAYNALDDQSNQLGHALRESGIEAGKLVAICLGRSADFVVGILGALKAGAAYVPIDPSYPPDRLAFMLADAAPDALVTSKSAAPATSTFTKPVIFMDGDRSALSRMPRTRLTRACGENDVAYAMYTSGSTGIPKAVLVEHHSVINLLSDLEGRSPTFRARHSSVSSFSFDASIPEIFGPLTTGGSMWIAPDDVRFDADVMMAWMSNAGIEAAFVPPSLVRRLKPPAMPASLRRLSVGVEPLREDHLASLRRHGLPRIMNGYGPTETTVYSTLYEVPPSVHTPRYAPIGVPITKTHIHLLDPALSPVPVGEVGEVYIAGEGVARGYLGRPELTSERFVQDPSCATGRRCYRTGDLARYLPDGNLEFVGRIDHQVKVRGHRVEPGEIEATLAQYPRVEQSVVTTQEDDSGDRRLVALVVAAGLGADGSSELRRFLRARLPEYMIPSVIAVVPDLPLAANGKVDRARLPELASPAPEVNTSKRRTSPPSDEEVVASVWRELLGIADVAPTDDFFDVGGDSLKAAEMVAELDRITGVRIALSSFFRASTLEGLGCLLRETVRQQSSDGHAQERD